MVVRQSIKSLQCTFLEAQMFAGAGTEAFCSGGDQRVRGVGGYVGADTVPRLNVLDLQVGGLDYDSSYLLLTATHASDQPTSLMFCEAFMRSAPSFL